MLATNTSTFDGQKLTPSELRGVCETVPFLAEKRLVIIQGLLGRFEPKGRTRSRKGADKGGGNDARSFAEAMSNIPESTVVVLTDGRIKSTNTLLK